MMGKSDVLWPLLSRKIHKTLYLLLHDLKSFAHCMKTVSMLTNNASPERKHVEQVSSVAPARHTKTMRILVIIANYGNRNDEYLHRLLSEYRSMSYRVHVVVLTNVPKTLGQEIEVIVKIPHGDPWSFPFPHKEIMAQRIEDYDLFIYSEDDTLITERNVAAFLRATKELPESTIAGFLRVERDSTDSVYFPDVHKQFHWDPDSVSSVGQEVFAHFSNEHSACYIITKKQLKRAIDSGGFLSSPSEGKYDLLVTAATDPYTKCGMRKMICISHLDDFLVPHLSNKYAGRLGLEESELHLQVEALLEIARGDRPPAKLLDVETKVRFQEWSKDYQETCNDAALSLVSAGTRNVLSVGCGQGLTEKKLVDRGIRVVALPLDSVIASCAEAKGVSVVLGDFQTAAARLDDDRFDCILLLNILHLLPNPVSTLADLSRLLSPGGRILVGVPNFSYLPYVWHRLRRDPQFKDLHSYEKSGLHPTTWVMVSGWLRRCQLKTENLVTVVPRRLQGLSPFLRARTSVLCGSEILISARKRA